MCWIILDTRKSWHRKGIFPNFLFLHFLFFRLFISQLFPIIKSSSDTFQWRSHSWCDDTDDENFSSLPQNIIYRNFEDRTHSLSIFNFFAIEKAKIYFIMAFPVKIFASKLMKIIIFIDFSAHFLHMKQTS